MRNYVYSLMTDQRHGAVASVAKGFLRLLSCVYGCAVWFVRGTRGIFKRRVKGLKVISVGNITVGGTGKTPLVELICRFLQEKGRIVTVVSRGYGRFSSVGDEPRMLERRLPGVRVVVDANRYRAERKAARLGADTVVFDDGFQQWHLAKDLDIAVVDSTRAFGNGRLLPRGILREPVSALKRADVIVVTKTNLSAASPDLYNRLIAANPGALIVEAAHQPQDLYEALDPRRTFPVEFLRGRKVAVFSAIGDPVSFEGLVRSCGGIIGFSAAFEDHHPYSSDDIKRIIEQCALKQVPTVITTEKDAVRLEGLIPPTCSILVLRVRMTLVKNEQHFLDRLLKLYPV